MRAKCYPCLLAAVLLFASLCLSPACVRLDTRGRVRPESAPYTIRRVDSSPERMPVRLLCEIPELDGRSFGDARINAFFSAMLRSCAASEWERLRAEASAERIPASEEAPLRDCRTAEVTLCTDKLFSAAMQYDRYLGGVTDYGIDGYTFDRESGERLSLRDVVSVGEARVREAIAAALPARYPDILEIKGANGKTPLDAIRSKPFDSFDFYLTDSGGIVVVFDKYEIAPGAAGMFSVELDAMYSRDLSDIGKAPPLYISLKKC